MAVKLVLDMGKTQDGFFEETAMIGIASAQPGYRFCWLLNEHFDISFGRDPEQEHILLQKKDKKKNEQQFNFPVYQYELPDSAHKYILYKLKDGVESLLPEARHMDYLWLIQTGDAEHDAFHIVSELKNIPEVQLAQILAPDQLKSLANLLV